MNSELNCDELCFAEEGPPRPRESGLGAWKVMIVDDDDFVHRVTILTLGEYRFENRRLEYLHAYSAAEARRLLAENPDTAVIMLDVVMETENAGLDFARHVRREARNPLVRIILRTGQPGQAPERTVITEYDINDYRNKAELSEQRLVTSLTTALRSYRDLQSVEWSRLGLRNVVCALADLFSLTAIPGFLDMALESLARIGQCPCPSAADHDRAVVVSVHEGRHVIQTARGFESSQGLSRDMVARLDDAIAAAGRGHRIRVAEREFSACFRNAHTGEDYVFMVAFPCPMDDMTRDLLQILGGNIGLALGNLFLNEEIVATQREVVLTLGEVVETRSKETAQHVKRVAEFSHVLAIRAGLPQDQAQLLRLASPMHDVGKIGIPDSVLLKPGKLTDEEYALVKTHTVIGHSILKNSPRRILRAAATIAHEHHERWDGLGYPRGLAGEDIHIFGRVTALADVFDALSSARVYKRAWPLEDILDYLREHRGRQFDPALVDVFFEGLPEIVAIRDSYPD
ncbi:MAG: DUF3369 domain-containing protein [Deltaproteobacteria bacterium]|nr:DUF3369 domain-containing protein [Deltaproteobacteria bacterium]